MMIILFEIVKGEDMNKNSQTPERHVPTHQLVICFAEYGDNGLDKRDRREICNQFMKMTNGFIVKKAD
jgi:hypothetical protein